MVFVTANEAFVAAHEKKRIHILILAIVIILR